MPTSLRGVSRSFRLLLLLAISSVTFVTAMAQGFGPAGPSPVTGHASVVASGTVDLTDASARWHVTRHITEEGGSTYVSETQGFLIAEYTPLFITLPDGSQIRLAGGEALSIAANTEVQVDTFGAPDSFLFMQTLPEQGAQLEGASDRILTSASFDTQPGSFSTSLVRDVLSENEEGTMPSGVVPTAIYVMVGELEIESDRGTITLMQGDSATFEGDLTITAVADGSIYYAGFIGAQLPAQATPVSSPAIVEEATPEPATPEQTEAPVEIPATPEPTAVPPTPEPTAVPATPDAVEPAPTDVPAVEPTALPNEGDSFTDAGSNHGIIIRERQ